MCIIENNFKELYKELLSIRDDESRYKDYIEVTINKLSDLLNTNCNNHDNIPVSIFLEEQLTNNNIDSLVTGLYYTSGNDVERVVNNDSSVVVELRNSGVIIIPKPCKISREHPTSPYYHVFHMNKKILDINLKNTETRYEGDIMNIIYNCDNIKNIPNKVHQYIENELNTTLNDEDIPIVTRNNLIIDIIKNTGISLKEIASLKTEDFSNNVIESYNNKYELNETLVDELGMYIHYLNIEDDDFIFTN